MCSVTDTSWGGEVGVICHPPNLFLFDGAASTAVPVQMAVAVYFLDKLALRAGHEKDDDEADTVGCCTLKVSVSYGVTGTAAQRVHCWCQCVVCKVMDARCLLRACWSTCLVRCVQPDAVCLHAVSQ
jgi:hypothetical protein